MKETDSGGAEMTPTWTRTILAAVAAGTLGLAISGGAVAQNAPSASAEDNLGSAQQAAAAADASAQADQPMSLGELARIARAKKQNEAKAAKVYDENNLPRGGGISVVGGASDWAGGTGSAASTRKVVLLDFWASWCGPCRRSVPDLKQLQKTYGSDQLEVISVNEDQDEKAGRNFVAQNQMNWEQRFDADGEMSQQYNVHAFPTFILTDENGTELRRFTGEDPNQPLAERVGPYLNKTPAGKT
jgi:thiol-disulfide isomerase/thioredoxin